MNTSDLSLFIRIVETGSITETAKQLNITAAAVSSALKRLEKQVGVQLIVRTTRRLRITPQGEQYLFHCRQALNSLEQGKAAAHQSQGTISGKLRLSAPSDLGRNTLLPWLDELLDEHPMLSVDLLIDDELSDLFMDQVDVALRYGKPKDSSLVSFAIATLERISCASPAYLSEFGEPSHPKQLIDHRCLLHRKEGRLFNVWEYKSQDGTEKVTLASTRTSNDTDIVKRWALAGRGIAYRSSIDVKQELESGQLKPILTDYESPGVELHLISPSREQVSPAVIALRELLREKLRSI